jgi:asparagine synthase (glutamine-hydrolysing)
MCGIVGIYNLAGGTVEREQVERMNACIVHRGPDEEGVWAKGPVAIAMRRLSIIDLACGQQPMSNEDGTVWIVFNGEVYNFHDLRQRLEAKGHKFRTHSDTEAIVHAYEEWGEECPKYLRGMFAFAIYDMRGGHGNSVLFLARDRVGKKPLLYTTTTDNQFIWGSEFRAILSNSNVPRRPHLGAIDAYLAASCVPSPLTAYEEIHKLPAAHSLTIKNGELKLQRYWTLDFSNKLAISEEDAVQELIERLDEAVHLRMISEVPLGAFLSGGVDSSAIVAMMARHSSRPVKTFSIGFKEKEYSEVEHARRIAKFYGTDHTEVIVEPDALAILPTLVRHYGEPYADSSAVPTFYVSQVTSKHVTVALNGDGGDELFAGYERHRAMRFVEMAHPALMKSGAALSNLMPDGTNFRAFHVRAKRLLQAAALPRSQRYLQWMSAFSAAQKRELYTREFAHESGFGRTRHPIEKWLIDNKELDVVDACLLTDTMTYLSDDLLVKVDITSMANSLEARSPFLDTPLMEWAARLPSDYKLRGKGLKHILRKALADEKLVPLENMDRPKMGFGVPIRHWFRDEMKELLFDTVLSDRAMARGYFERDIVKRYVDEHLRDKQDHAYRLWALLMLELWHREFID